MKLLIIEDELPAARRVKNLIAEIDATIEVLEVIDSVESAVKWLRNYQRPDLILMDIQLADGLSFEIFDRITIQSPVIFTTAYDEYALRAFKVNSIDYLLKPIDKAELTQSITKFRNIKAQFADTAPNSLNIENLLTSLKLSQKEYKTRFLVKLGDRLVPILIEDVAYFQAEEKIVLLVTQDNKRYAVDFTLDALDSQLNPSLFYRINRKFIAHFHSIKHIHTYYNGKLKIQLLPEVKEEVTVSREKSGDFKEWLEGIRN
jgi:two-component system LytT family response regulator